MSARCVNNIRQTYTQKQRCLLVCLCVCLWEGGLCVSERGCEGVCVCACTCVCLLVCLGVRVCEF